MAVPVPSEPDGSAAPTPDLSTRDRLLDAAHELLLRRGYQATTVQAVARHAGLTTGAIYANFGGKQELMAHAVLADWYRTERALLDELLAAHTPGYRPDAPPDDDDGQAGEALLQVLARHVATPAAPRHRLLTEVTGAIVRDDIEQSPLLVSVKMIEQLTRASVESGKARGDISPDLGTDALVAVIVNVYLGAITSKALGLPQPSLDETLRVLRSATSGYALGGGRGSDQGDDDGG